MSDKAFALAVTRLKEGRGYYDRSVKKHRRATLWTNGVVVLLGSAAVALLAVKAFSLGTGLAEWLQEMGLIARGGLIAGALSAGDDSAHFPAVVLGGVALFASRYAERRGYIRAWTRSAVTRQRLDAEIGKIEFASERFAGSNDPAEQASLLGEAAAAFHAGLAEVTRETEQWAVDLAKDLGSVSLLFRESIDKQASVGGR